MSLEKMKKQYLHEAKVNELKGEISLNIDTMRINEYVKDKKDILESDFYICFKNVPLYVKDTITNYLETDPEIKFITVEPAFTQSTELLWDLIFKGHSEKLTIVKLLFGGHYLEEIVNIIDPNNEMYLEDYLIDAAKNSWMTDEYFGKDLKNSLIEFYKLMKEFPLKFPMHPNEINKVTKKVTNRSKFRTMILKKLEIENLREFFMKLCKDTYNIKNNELFFLVIDKITNMDEIVLEGGKTKHILDEELLEKINNNFSDDFKAIIVRDKKDYNIDYCNELLDFVSALEDFLYEDEKTDDFNSIDIEAIENVEDLIKKFGEDPNAAIQEMLSKNPNMLSEILNLSEQVEDIPEDIKDKMEKIGEDKDVEVKAISMSNFLEILKKVKK